MTSRLLRTYQNSLIPTISKPTRVTIKTATVIDHILANSFVDTSFKSATFKTDIFHHIPVCLFLFFFHHLRLSQKEAIFIYKGIVNTLAI